MSPFKDFTVCREAEIYPYTMAKEGKGCWSKPKRTELDRSCRQDLTSPPLFHPAAPPSFPLQHQQHSPQPPEDNRKAVLDEAGGFSCLPPSPHLPCLDFARRKINHIHSIPGHHPQGAETSSPPWSPAGNMGLSGTKGKPSETHTPFGERGGSMGIIAGS